MIVQKCQPISGFFLPPFFKRKQGLVWIWTLPCGGWNIAVSQWWRCLSATHEWDLYKPPKTLPLQQTINKRGVRWDAAVLWTDRAVRWTRQPQALLRDSHEQQKPRDRLGNSRADRATSEPVRWAKAAMLTAPRVGWELPKAGVFPTAVTEQTHAISRAESRSSFPLWIYNFV